MSGLNLDFTGVKESGFGTMPEGEYPVIVDNAEIKETRDGTGQYINCKLKVTHGEFAGRFLFTMFNIKNKNVQAVEIGLSQLKTFRRIAGISANTMTDVLELVGHKANAMVKIKTDSYGEKNVVSYFKPFKALAAKEKEQNDLPF